MFNQGRLPWGQEEQDCLHTELFSSLLSSEWAFSDIVDSLVQENLSGGKPLDHQIIVILLGDQYIKHFFSGKEFRDQTLALRSFCMLLQSLEVLPSCPRYARAFLALIQFHLKRVSRGVWSSVVMTTSNNECYKYRAVVAILIKISCSFCCKE